MKKIYSKWTGDDLTSIESQIRDAQLVYQKYVDDYNWGIQYGSSSYAKRVRKPRVDAAKAVLDTLQAQKQAMLSDMGSEQALSIVDTTVDVALTEPENETPWTTIALAVGALILIVIIVKLV